MVLLVTTGERSYYVPELDAITILQRLNTAFCQQVLVECNAIDTVYILNTIGTISQRNDAGVLLTYRQVTE